MKDPKTGALMTAVLAAQYDVNQWLESCGYDPLTNDQRAVMLALDAESMADCDGMLDDLAVRVGVSEADLDSLRWAIEAYRAAFGKGGV